MKVVKQIIKLLIITICVTLVAYCRFGHLEPYDFTLIEGTPFCAIRYDSWYYDLFLYEKDKGEAHTRIISDPLQSVIYGNNVAVVKCGLRDDFFVRYYFVSYDLENYGNYKLSGPLSEQACLDSLKNRNIDPSKMKISLYENDDFREHEYYDAYERYQSIKETEETFWKLEEERIRRSISLEQ